MNDRDRGSERLKRPPLSETIEDAPFSSEVPLSRAHSVVTEPADPTAEIPSALPTQSVALGEALQLVRFSKHGQVLKISGLTPHGRRLTFEQREDREGWYVVTAGRRRRPTERELGLVVASITQEMEAASVADGDAEVRSAYRLAVASEQPGLPVRGLQAYRDLLLDDAQSFLNGSLQRLGVVALEYQAFKRFAIRHGHRIGMAFVRALGERLEDLYSNEAGVTPFHKSGKAFRLICSGRTPGEIRKLAEKVASRESRDYIVERVWGQQARTHPDEVNFGIGLAMALKSELDIGSNRALAQRLNDDAFRAARLGMLVGHTSLAAAKSDYRTTFYRWTKASKHELELVEADMDDGPAEVMAEMVDYLHELVPADLEGMAVDGDVDALIHKAIFRESFWQGLTAMRIAGERLLDRFMSGAECPEGQVNACGGFALGDEFWGIALEHGSLYFAWGDLNAAGATRTRAGLAHIQRAVGWRRDDGGGLGGEFMRALPRGTDPDRPLVDRVRDVAQTSFEALWSDPAYHVADSVDIFDALRTSKGDPVRADDLVEGRTLRLQLPGRGLEVKILERRSGFFGRLAIDGQEHSAVITETPSGLMVKLRIKKTVVSAAVCILRTQRTELEGMLEIIREDNEIDPGTPLNLLGFMRHIADLLLLDEVKTPEKIGLALGNTYSAARFVQSFSLEDVREKHPGLFYEAVHHNLLAEPTYTIDKNLRELIESAMLAKPSSSSP